MKMRFINIGVGFFVVLGLCSFLMLAMQVSGLSSFFQEETGYRVYGLFKNIGGLKARSKVTINGVTIGRVSKISLDQDEFGEFNAMVDMVIYHEYNKLPKDSVAKILTSGLLGDNYIGIEAGMDENVLVHGDRISLTTQALLLEDLISKFAVGSGGRE